jgi:Holliday junction resolvase
MSRMSKTKGKVGEREVAQLLRDHGFDARRGVQFQGGSDSPDVIGLPGFHLEVKRCEAFRLYSALEQAMSEKGDGDIPAVFHRANQRPWVVVLNAGDFLAMARALQARESRVDA